MSNTSAYQTWACRGAFPLARLCISHWSGLTVCLQYSIDSLAEWIKHMNEMSHKQLSIAVRPSRCKASFIASPFLSPHSPNQPLHDNPHPRSTPHPSHRTFFHVHLLVGFLKARDVRTFLATPCLEKGATLFSTVSNSRISWLIFVIFAPLETGVNTSQ